MQSLNRYSVSAFDRQDLRGYSSAKRQSYNNDSNNDLRNMLLLLIVLAGLFLALILCLPQMNSLY